MTARCWWCGHEPHDLPCAYSWQSLDESGICLCERTLADHDEKLVGMLSAAIAVARRGPDAKVRQTDEELARASLPEVKS